VRSHADVERSSSLPTRYHEHEQQSGKTSMTTGGPDSRKEQGAAVTPLSSWLSRTPKIPLRWWLQAQR
jgi:hypothetical protein